MTPPPDLPDRLGPLAEQWFQRAAASLPGTIPCRQGCSRCCIGLFSITILDAARLREGLETLAPDTRAAITKTAREQIAALEAASPKLKTSSYLDDWAETELDRLSTGFDAWPCPALGQDGSCRLYAFRPVTCRTMGIPEEREGLTHGACEVQTFVPIRRLAERLREEEQMIAREEALALEAARRQTGQPGEELWLPYGFAWNA